MTEILSRASEMLVVKIRFLSTTLAIVYSSPGSKMGIFP